MTSSRGAGEERVPFTTGLLIGIGETRVERLEALLAIRQLHQKYGHVQELIIQNFRCAPKRPPSKTSLMLYLRFRFRLLLLSCFRVSGERLIRAFSLNLEKARKGSLRMML